MDDHWALGFNEMYYVKNLQLYFQFFNIFIYIRLFGILYSGYSTPPCLLGMFKLQRIKYFPLK